MTELSVYQKIKNAKNPSERTQKFFKRYPFRKVWAMGKENESLKSVIKKGLDQALILGNPGSELSPDSHYFNQTSVKTNSFMGRYFTNVYCGIGGGDINLVGINKKVGVWFVDVTDLFIKEYNEKGQCALHGSGHEFVMKSTRIKECKFCKKRFKKKVVIKKSIEWVKL